MFEQQLSKVIFDYKWEQGGGDGLDPHMVHLLKEKYKKAIMACVSTRATKPFLKYNSLSSFVEVVPRILGEGGEAIIMEGRVHWDRVPNRLLLRIRSHEIAEEQGKTIDKVAKSTYKQAREELEKLRGLAKKKEKERLLERIMNRFEKDKCAVRLPHSHKPQTKRGGRAQIYIGKNTEGLLCFLDHGKTKDRKDIYVTELIEEIVDPEKIKDEFTLDKIVGIMIKATRGVKALHENNIWHRDIKPANIFVDKKGRAYIGDHGIIRAYNIMENGVDLMQSYRTMDDVKKGEILVFGTPEYISPEGAYGLHLLCKESDIYMLAGTFYEWLTGIPPNQPASGRNGTDMVQNVRRYENKTRIIRPSRLIQEPGIEGVELVIAHGLQPYPQHRPIAEEMLTDLQYIKSGTNAFYAIREASEYGKLQEIETLRHNQAIMESEGKKGQAKFVQQDIDRIATMSQVNEDKLDIYIEAFKQTIYH